MAIVGEDGGWLETNAALSRITGYSRDELLAMTLYGMTHPDDVALAADLEQRLRGGQIQSYQIEKRCRHARGEYIWVMVTVSLVRDDLGRPLYAISQVQDISERKQVAEGLEYLVDHDFVTGLFNRRRFEQELSKETQRVARYGAPGALILVDLDHFKEVNDALGHKVGDDLLQEVASALRRRIRQTDVLARVGGDEFAVLLPHTGAQQAESVAGGIVAAVRRHVEVDGGPSSIPVTASVGVALCDGPDATELMVRADHAMYEAKAAGRDRVVLYQPKSEAGQALRPRVKTERDVRSVGEDRGRLYCRPILHLGTNEIRQHQLLLLRPRGRAGEQRALSTVAGGAARSRLTQTMDSWVVRKAIAMIARHEKAGQKLLLHIELSGASINSSVAARIESDLTRTGIDPASLVLGVADLARIANIEEAKAFTQRLRRRGCQFVLDDFPSSGSFYYVRNLEFDYLRINGDFVRGIAGSAADRVVVQALVDIARGLGMETIADLVSDEPTARLLRQSGIDYATGAHVGQPYPLNELELVTDPKTARRSRWSGMEGGGWPATVPAKTTFEDSPRGCGAWT
jgi:diguanylate cyclase (GGDEF)-like protein/PAS domain S-box-containing protein